MNQIAVEAPVVQQRRQQSLTCYQLWLPSLRVLHSDLHAFYSKHLYTPAGLSCSADHCTLVAQQSAHDIPGLFCFPTVTHPGSIRPPKFL